MARTGAPQREQVSVVTVREREAPQYGQKSARERTDLPQLEQVERAPVAEVVTATGLPHCLQKRAPGRSAAPQ